MNNERSFNVVSTGDIVEGIERVQVLGHLQSVLKLPAAQAEQFFDRPRVIKKNQPEPVAVKLQSQLKQLGVVSILQPVLPAPSQPVAPTSPPPSVSQSVEGLTLVEDDAPPTETVAPPEQTSTYSSTISTTQTISAAVPTAAVVKEEPGSFNIVALGAALMTALAGAWVWQFIGLKFGYELGLIAWGIGGAVGFAAAACGSRGMVAGIVCGALVVLSLALGKVWTYNGFSDQVLALAQSDSEEFLGYYEEEQEDARLLVRGDGSDRFVRQFMYERDYTDADSADAISQAEIDEFREFVEPDLRRVAANPQSFEEWKDSGFGLIEDLSTWEIIRNDFGFLDILFLFLGVGTAFRMASQIS
ncbi:MAG: hypothetical protein AAGA84_00790 [Pseudomonadota bacterium]